MNSAGWASLHYNRKFRIENIPEDYCQYKVINVYPYFENVTNASAFSAEIGWSDRAPRSRTLLRSPRHRRSMEIRPK
ncbi:MAG: hypothetical protein ACYC0V_20045 [Armatimonadota bacterium]